MSGSILQFPLRLGLSEDANPKSPPVSSLKRGHNIRWVKDGVIGKSYAFAEHIEMPEIAGEPLRFITRGSELSVTDGEDIFTLQPETSTWRHAGLVPEAHAEWTTLLDDEKGVASADVAIVGDHMLVAWVTGDPTERSEANVNGGGSLFVQVVHRETRSVVVAPRQIHGIARFVRIVVIGTWAVVLFALEEDIIALSTDLSADVPVVGSTVAPIIANLRFDDDDESTSVNGRFDAIVLASGVVVVGYEAESTGLGLQRFTFSAGALANSGSFLAVSATRVQALALTESNDRVNVLYSAPNGSDYPMHIIGFFAATISTWASAVAATNVVTDFWGHHVALANTTSGLLAAWSGIRQYNDESDLSHPQLCSVRLTASGEMVDTTLRVSTAMALLSGLFTMGSRYYVLARDATHGENEYILDEETDNPTGSDEREALPSLSSYAIEVALIGGLSLPLYEPHRVVAKVDHDIAAPFVRGSLPKVATSGERVYGLSTFQATASPVAFSLRTGLRLITLTSDARLASDPWRSATIGLEAYVVGASFSAWDGVRVFDHGMRAPYFVDARLYDVGGLMGNGAYIYQAHAAFRSRAGVLHRGPLSRTIKVPQLDVGDTIAVVLWFAPHAIDCKQDLSTGYGLQGANGAFFEVFRTEANGATFYQFTYTPRVRQFSNDPIVADWLLELGDTSNDTDIGGGADDHMPAVALASRPQPYPTTGELEDVQPSGCVTSCLHLNRLFTISGNRRELWFTKDASEAPNVAPGFSPDLRRFFDRDITAICSHADRLIVFFERGAKFIVGDGPTSAGTDDRFSTPQSIPNDVGTTNPRSVVATPLGIFFQETSGELMLLDNGLGVQWIGKDVRDTLATYPVITSAVHVPEQGEVRFTCNMPDGESEDVEGIMLVFDYRRGTWITRATPGDEPANDAILCGGAYYLATASGVWCEMTGEYLDSEGAFRPSTIVLAPIAPSGPASWHRVKRVQLLGQSLSPHELTIAIARDFADATEQTKTFDSDSDVTQVGPLERAQVALAKQKAQAIEVHITDGAPSGDVETGEGVRLEGVAFLVQTKQGLARITQSRRG